MKKGKPVLVTTEHKGVFFGYTQNALAEPIHLDGARNCNYWGVSMKGFMGLAAMGPDNSCKIGPAVDGVTLYKVTGVFAVTPEAVKKWEAAPWG